ARAMVRGTLRAMAYGGIYDQVGGGFYRYSVDRFWAIPHFEKMLYDNGQLLALYADAARVLEEPLFARIAAETGEWVMREMQAPEGGYYSSLDADSEGHEGKYYVWTLDELRAAVEPEEYAVLEQRFGLHRPANFEERWHLNVYAEAPDIAATLGLTEAEVERRLAAARARLYAFRERRVRPGLDDKILASWNALMIKGMARAGRLLGREDFVASAQRALDFVRGTLWRGGRLLATARGGRAQLNAYLDDHALLIEAALELLQVRWRRDDLAFAVALAHRLLDGFEDRTAGGFYFTSNDHEPLVHRPKPASDDALPAGNGAAARALLALGYLLGDVDFLNAAERALRAHYARVTQYPSAHCTLLLALEQYLEPPTTVVLRGTAEELRAWQAAMASGAGQEVYPIPADAPDLPGVLAERKPLGGATAYVCRGHTCRPPVTDLAALRRLLAEDTL
ncbi:MAG TPA: thioredoxin, partial [Burkholderiales bacterium]